MARAVVLLLLGTGSRAELSIGVDGGYTNVLVRVEEGVGAGRCREVLAQLSELLAEGSEQLNQELAGRAYFHSFVLEVPRGWGEAACGYSEDREAVVGGGARPDILVLPGSGPVRVEQVVGCGAGGEGLYLSEEGLADIGGGELVARWMEYRYGVFDWGEEEAANQTELSRHQEVCGGRGREEVVQGHADFRAVRTDGEPERALVPEVRVVRRRPERLVLAVETTEGMLADDTWRWVNKAVQKAVRWDLSADTEVAVVSFSNTSRVEWGPGVLVGQEERDLAADSVPGKYQLAAHGGLCVSCLLQSVAGGVLAGARGHVVLLTRGGQDSLSLTDEVVIRSLVASTGLRVSSVLLPSNSSGPPLPFYDEVATLSGGASLLVRPSPNPMASYVGVVQALGSVLGGAQMVHLAPAAGSGGETTGEFVIDSSLGRDTQFGVYVADPEDHMVRAVTFRDEQGTVYGPYRKMSSSYDLINLKTPNIGEGPKPFYLGGSRRWRYTVEWWGGRGAREEGVVAVTSAASGSEGREVTAWARVGEDCGEVTLYCKVVRGGLGVEGAVVEAVVEVTGPGGEVAEVAVTLQDDGWGEPDLTAGDGVYSAMVPEYPGPGRYSVRLVVEEQGEDSARAEVHGPTLHLATAPTPCTAPRRVRDLTVSSSNSTLVAAWGSAGGVSSYSLLYSPTLAGLLGPEAGSLLELEVDQAGPEEVRVEDVTSPLYDQLYYVALVETDSAGRRSRLSNIETVWVEEPEEPEASLHLPILGLPAPASSDDWFIIVLISAGLGGLLLLSLLAIIFFLVTSRRKSRRAVDERVESPVSSTKGPPSVSEYQTDSSSCGSDSRQVTDLRQVMSHLPRAPGLGPTYWSASQILAKHQPPGSLSSSFDNQGYGWAAGEAVTEGRRRDSYRNFGAPPTPPKPVGLVRALQQQEEDYRRRLSPGLGPDDEGYDSASREVHLIVQARNITEV
jgi:hypothetical protein